MDPIDALVGARIRQRRRLKGLSQHELGKALSITYQQIQKYERGINRVSASRLKQISDVLGVPPEYFFYTTSDRPTTADDILAIASRDPLARRLNDAFVRIENRALRKSILVMIELVGREATPVEAPDELCIK